MNDILYAVLSVIVLINTPIFILCSLICFASGWIGAGRPGQKTGVLLRGVASGLCLMLFASEVVLRQYVYSLVPVIIFYWIYPAGFAAGKLARGKGREINPYHMIAFILFVMFVCYDIYAIVWTLGR